MWQRTSLCLIAKPYNTEKLRLLTYTQALTKPNTTLPYLSQHRENNEAELINTLSNIYTINSKTNYTNSNMYKDLSCNVNGSETTPYHDNHEDESSSEPESSIVLEPRRWVRDADELCVAEMRRSTNINKLNTYIATYKLDHPHWQPLLLPEVHLVPSSSSSSSSFSSPSSLPTLIATKIKDESAKSSCSCNNYDESEREVNADDNYNNNNNNNDNRKENDKEESFDVYIDYNKLTSLELMSRHANFALRHIVQKGHAMYFITHAQHSILAMRGVVEASHVTTAYGINEECLRTYITHVGPLDVREVIEIDPVTHRVSFNFDKPNVARGVVALSQVEGYGTWFERRTMLWQRTRRVGAMQSSLGTLDYTLAHPLQVGKLREYEVSLLEPHMQLFKNNGSFSGGAAQATGLIASTQVAQNAKLYLGQFEAPAFVVLDAVEQLSHYSALDHKLIHDVPTRESIANAAMLSLANSNINTKLKASIQVQEEELPLQSNECDCNVNATNTSICNDAKANTENGRVEHKLQEPLSWSEYEYKELSELIDVRQRLESEKLLPVSWLSRSPPPYIPAEVDLPFKIQLSRPTVFPCKRTLQHSLQRKDNNSNNSSTSIMDDNRRANSEHVEVTPAESARHEATDNNNNDDDENEEEVRCFPTGTAVGSPYIVNVPITLFEFNIHQGASHYLYDESPSSRPLKWWSQRNNLPYSGYMYFMRSQLIDDAKAAEQIDNPILLNTENRKVQTKQKRQSKTKTIKQHYNANDGKEQDTNTHTSDHTMPKEQATPQLEKVASNNNTDCNNQRKITKHCEQWVSSHKELVGFVESDDENDICDGDHEQLTSHKMKRAHECKRKKHLMTRDSDDTEINEMHDGAENERPHFRDIIKASSRARKRASLYKKLIKSAQTNTSKVKKQREKKQSERNVLQKSREVEQDTNSFGDANHTSCKAKTQTRKFNAEKTTSTTSNATRMTKAHSLSQLRKALAAHSSKK